MSTVDGVLVLNSSDGCLIYDNEVKENYGLNASLGGNELQLCAMIYTLYISSASVENKNDANMDGENEDENSSSLHWIKSGESVLYFMKQRSVLVVTVNSVIPSPDVCLDGNKDMELTDDVQVPMPFSAILTQICDQVKAIHKTYFSIVDDINYRNTKEYMRLNKMKIDLLRNTMNAKLKKQNLLPDSVSAKAVAGFSTEGPEAVRSNGQGNITGQLLVGGSATDTTALADALLTADIAEMSTHAGDKDIVLAIDTPRCPETRVPDATAPGSIKPASLWWCCG